MENKTVIKKLFYYLLLRNVPAAFILFGAATRQPVSEYFLKEALNLPGFFFAGILPLLLFDVLLFGAPYYWLIKRFLREGLGQADLWCWSGLLLLEIALIRVALFNDISILLLAAFFIYFRIFTWYFLTGLQQR